jgi:L-2,4-diaminobutyrate decarboxylase
MADTDGNHIYSGASPEQVQADLEPLVDFQNEGLSLEELRNLIENRLAPHLMRYDLPTFQSMFNAFPEEGAKFGARVALTWNQGVTNWQVSPGGAVLEELSIRALCSLFGLSPGSDGTAMYCGSYANQQALYMALHKIAEDHGFNLAETGVRGFEDPARLAVLTSKDAHFSLRHAVRLLGLGERSLITVEVDTNRRMDIENLQETLAQLEGSRDVFCVVATAGTTPTGSVDPILPVADICEQLGSWLHVDGAYGLAYQLVPEWRHLFAGVERADSLSWDPHKQFGVPIPSSVLFVRQQEDFGRMALFSSYFNRPDSAHPNPGVKSVPSTRPLSVLPLVTSIRHQGLKGVVARLRAPLVSIRELADYLVQQQDLELCHQPDTGILCFRIVPAELSEEKLNQLQQNIYNRIIRQGERTISLTQLDGRTVLRLVAVSPAVTATAMMDTIDAVRRVAEAERPT